MLRLRVTIPFVLVSVLAISACVRPIPPPGEPVPSLQVVVDQPSPVEGVVTITATPANFDPVNVAFLLDSLNAPPIASDNTSPYTVAIDSDTIARGNHTVFAVGVDGTSVVLGVATFTSRPNFVFVLVDDMDAMTMPLWDALPKTKAAIGDRGTTFTNAFAPDPVCCPARATLLTGKYPHNTGVFNHTPPAGGYPVFVSGGAENDTVATRLHDGGYRTGFVGKYLNGYELDASAVPPGWDEWFGLAGTLYDGYTYEANHNGTMESYGTAATDYQTDVLGARGSAFVDSTESNDDQPFFLHLAPSAPHAPIPPAVRHTTNAFTDDPLLGHVNFNEVDVSDKPEWLRDGVPQLDSSKIAFEEQAYRRMMGSLLAVDDMVSSVVTALKANGEFDSTTLVFMSDNGFLFGAHRLTQKIAPYEESIRVPFAMAGPGVPHGVESALVTQADVMPTLLDLAGIAVPDDVDGRSLRPLLNGTAGEWRDDFLLEFEGTYNVLYPLHTLANVRTIIGAGAAMLVPTYRAVRTEQHLYVEWYGGSEHDYELYDLVDDPGQMSNLVATPEGAAEHAALTEQLQTRLEELAICSGISCRS